MSRALKRQAYELVGRGVLATAQPSDVAWTLPRRRIRTLPVSARARVAVQFFPGGPWDLVAEPFGIHRYVQELFVEGIPVAQSEQYRDMVARVANPGLGGEVWGCGTVADVERYFENLFAIFEDMRTHGYRSHKELGATPQAEVNVRVGRNGALIKASGGNHRVSFAKILGIARVPVLLCGIHREYLRRFPHCSRGWDGEALGSVLESVGLHEYHAPDIQQVARRLRWGNMRRKASVTR